jgi:hypothetical protein
VTYGGDDGDGLVDNNNALTTMATFGERVKNQLSYDETILVMYRPYKRACFGFIHIRYSTSLLLL